MNDEIDGIVQRFLARLPPWARDERPMRVRLEERVFIKALS